MAKKGTKKSISVSPKKSSATKTAKTKTASNSVTRPETSKPRQLKLTGYKSFKLQKRVKSPDAKVPGSFRLFKHAVLALTKHWPLFLGIIVIYALLSIILVGSLSLAGSTNLNQLKPSLSQNFGQVVTGLTLFAYLAGNSGTAGGTSQAVIGIIVSLALIWALRQVYLEGQLLVRIRDSFYRGMAPLIPFILVLIVLLIELIPLALGALLYATVVTNGIAVTGLEQAIFGVIFFLLAVASFYMLTSSVFALYIVTLPDMTPIKALKSATQLVHYRRGRVFLKLLFLAVALIVIAAIIIVPLAIFATAAAPYVFFILTLVFLTLAHSYVYALYRELI